MKTGMKYLCSLKDNRTVTKVSENLYIPSLIWVSQSSIVCAEQMLATLKRLVSAHRSQLSPKMTRPLGTPAFLLLLLFHLSNQLFANASSLPSAGLGIKEITSRKCENCLLQIGRCYIRCTSILVQPAIQELLAAPPDEEWDLARRVVDRKDLLVVLAKRGRNL
ncbi:hypothetical protein DAPPUDRAFT_251603 [Daphnia pulex]|uniref:Uncharacterized protein n=1 Tax=Daphnia pulex TaxID=6669 RepID=E9H0R0_DAPPU|nr:hypothetical protein DAPPUDRAFT_251603 [Daphnia pulex]|eukprot:EFX74687.1 hypothetical protein DAPPUDRAFT_251603 [Daphnia pulex]